MMTGSSENQRMHCIICNKIIVKDGTRASCNSLENIKKYASDWKILGHYSELSESIQNIQFSEDCLLYYHRSCYSSLTHKGHYERAKTSYEKKWIVVRVTDVMEGNLHLQQLMNQYLRSPESYLMINCVFSAKVIFLLQHCHK